MIDKKTTYPVNLTGIQQVGVDEWLNSYTPPFPPDKFQEVYETIAMLYAEAMNRVKKNDNIYYSAAVNYKMILLIANSFYDFLSLDKLKKDGCCSINDGSVIPIDMAITQAKSSSFLKDEYHEIPKFATFFEYLRYIKYNIKRHGLLRTLFCKVKKDVSLLADSENVYIRSYLNEQKSTPEYLRGLLFLKGWRNNNLTENDITDLNMFVDSVITPLQEKYGSDYFGVKFKNEFSQLYLSTASMFKHVANKLEDRQLAPLIVESIHYNYSRIIALPGMLKVVLLLVLLMGIVIFLGLNLVI